jgi:myo-inositol-1(or 4)-monophosphatase
LQDVDLLCQAVQEAGRLALTLFRQSVRNWRKDDNSPVSDADIAVDRLLHKRLIGARPSYGWLSEEAEDGPGRLSSRHVWVVDPIDGTRAFLKGGDQWCISAGLVRDGVPVAAAVYRPLKEHCFAAAKGAGATLNLGPIKASAHTEIAGARILGARQMAQKLAGSAALSAADVPLALRLCLIAEGRYDAFVAATPKNDWDICAGHLILEEAGGIVTDLSGQPCIYNRAEPFQRGIIASNRAIHGEIARALN